MYRTFSKPLAIFTALLAVILSAPSVEADNIADCEIVLIETIEDESGLGSAQVASYRPANDFIASVYNDDIDLFTDIDGLTIRGLLCRRNNIIVSKADHKILASGVPLILSQNFDSAASDLVTYYYKDGEFRYQDKGETLTIVQKQEIDTRLLEFSLHNQDIKKQQVNDNTQEDTQSAAPVTDVSGATLEQPINAAKKTDAP